MLEKRKFLIVTAKKAKKKKIIKQTKILDF